MLKYYAFRLGGALAGILPRRLGYALAAWLAWMISLLPLPANRALRANLRRVLGPDAEQKKVRRLARSALHNNVVNYYEMFLLPRLSPEEISRRVSIQGEERAWQALAAHKGLIITSPHLGNFNAVGQIIIYYRVRVTLVAQDLEPPRLYDYVTGLRSSQGFKIVPLNRSLRPIVRALRAKEAVALAIDRDVTGGGVWLPFFGAPARLPVGHVKLALRTGAPILPCFAVRESDSHSQVYIEEPLFLTPSDDPERDVREGAQRIVALMERYIRAYPDQWLAFQPVWGDGARGATA